MILQLLVKGGAVGFKRYAASGQDIEEVVCVNSVLVKVKYAQGDLIEAKQYAEDSGSVSGSAASMQLSGTSKVGNPAGR